MIPLSIDEKGNIKEWKRTYSFIPHGFLDTQLFALDNGDTTGFYWAIGKEHEQPILCDILHDIASLVPIASSLEGLIKLKWYIEGEDYDHIIHNTAKSLNLRLPEPSNHETYSLDHLLILDEKSPLHLVTIAIEHMKKDALKASENYLKSALEVLPEYALAHYHLARLYRRTREHTLDAIESMIQAICCPLVFFDLSLRAQVLSWLQRIPDQPQFREDPMWSNRKKLTFDIGVKTNDDFIIYEDAINEYLRQGKGIQAIRLREAMNDLMNVETLAFRERYNYSDERHKELLIENLRQAGLEDRIASVR